MRTVLQFACAALFTVGARAGDIRVVGIAEVDVKVSDLARSQRFYTDVLGFDAVGLRFPINDRQWIVLVPDRKDAADHHLARFTLAAADVGSACETLRAAARHEGTCEVTDADGNHVLITRHYPGVTPERTPSSRGISAHLRHVGIQVRDLDAAARFYQEKFGLVPEELRHGKTRWFNMHLPGGDYIQMQLTPETLSADRRWPFEHFGLDIDEAHAAYDTLIRRGIPPRPAFEPVVGYAGRLKINFLDPDNTLIELMETAAAKPGERREP